MSNRLLHSRERRLFRAGLMYRKGRARVLWLNGVFYFGGSLFALYNAVDYGIEPNARDTPAELRWFFAALGICVFAGYAYGYFLWRQLERQFGRD